MDTTPTSPTASRIYFRPTTASQRQLLFSTVAAGETVTAAARRAHVGRGTYYYWCERYETAGVAGLQDERSRAPQHPRLAPISAALEAEVLAYYDAHPRERGCRMIAERLRQAHDNQPVIGHSKVAAIIRVARATPSAAAARPAVTSPVTPAAAPPSTTAAVGAAAVRDAESPAPPVIAATLSGPPATTAAVHAPAPNQTANIDLCVVPLTHDGQHAWNAVSVSQAAAGATPEVNAPAPATPHAAHGQARRPGLP
jgi:cytochrome c5